MFANDFGEHKRVCCGLVRIIPRQEDWQPPIQAPIPLISVNVNASVVHAVAQVEVTQVYVNKEEKPIEAIYYFPVNPDGAVTHFQAELEGRIIKGTVKPQEEAKADYDKAVENKTMAFLGEETKADIFKVRVGFLKPGTQVKVTIGYVSEVKNEPGSKAIRFYIPTTIAPRYVSPSETDQTAEDIRKMEFSPSSPAPLSIKVAVSLQGGIKSIDSPTHKVKVDKGRTIPENELWHKATVELAGETTDMDRDFVLNIVPEEVHKARLYSEKSESGSTAVMVHMVPSFKLDEQKTELIFVLDRSGSMMGQSIELAKKALLLFLHSMPADCYFNVVGFGSSFSFLFPKSVKYDDGSLSTAVDHAKKLKADLGGTEILEPLKSIYGSAAMEGYLRQIFILTDGEVSNTDGVLGIAQANAHKARVFALGIGDGASHYLVEGVAKAGGGTSAFVTYNESIDRKVLNQLKNGLQPSLTEIEVVWDDVENLTGKAAPVINKEKTLLGYNKPVEPESGQQAKSHQQSPKNIPPVYDGSQLLVFGMFHDKLPTAVLIKAQSPDGPLTLKIEYSPQNDVGTTRMLHRLAAVKLIRELELEAAALHFQELDNVSEKEEALKKVIVDIACRNGITSKYTSFVAVDAAEGKPCPDSWVMETRNVPSQFAHGWHGGFGGGGGGMMLKRCMRSAPPMPMAMCMMAAGPPPPGVTRNAPNAPPVFGAFPLDEKRRKKSKKTSAMFVQAAQGSDDLMESDDFILDSEEGSNSASSETPLVQLISLQSFDGSYKLNEKLVQLLGKTMQECTEGATKNNLSEEVYATALAIVFFVTTLPEEKDVWELIVLKAKKWLKKTYQAGDVDTVLKLAETFLAPFEQMST